MKFGNEAWVLKKREEQRLEVAQMKFLRHLLGVTKLNKEKNQCIRHNTGAQNIVKEIKQYQKKTSYGLEDPGSNPGGDEIFRIRPDRPWGPPSLLYNGYQIFPGGKLAGAWR